MRASDNSAFDRFQRDRRGLKPRQRFLQRLTNAAEQFVFQPVRALLRAENLVFECFQILGDIALAVRQRLFARVFNRAPSRKTIW